MRTLALSYQFLRGTKLVRCTGAPRAEGMWGCFGPFGPRRCIVSLWLTSAGTGSGSPGGGPTWAPTAYSPRAPKHSKAQMASLILGCSRARDTGRLTPSLEPPAALSARKGAAPPPTKGSPFPADCPHHTCQPASGQLASNSGAHSPAAPRLTRLPSALSCQAGAPIVDEGFAPHRCNRP